MILSARWVRKPRKQRYCEECGRTMDSDLYRLVVLAKDDYDKPIMMFYHAGCYPIGWVDKYPAFALAVEARKKVMES